MPRCDLRSGSQPPLCSVLHGHLLKRRFIQQNIWAGRPRFDYRHDQDMDSTHPMGTGILSQENKVAGSLKMTNQTLRCRMLDIHRI